MFGGVSHEVPNPSFCMTHYILILMLWSWIKSHHNFHTSEEITNFKKIKGLEWNLSNYCHGHFGKKYKMIEKRSEFHEKLEKEMMDLVFSSISCGIFFLPTF